MKRSIFFLIFTIVASFAFAQKDKIPVAVMSTTDTGKSFCLTFYCDNKDHTSQGTVYHLNEEDESPEWFNFDFETNTNKNNITRVIFDSSFSSARPVTTNCWFAGCNKLEEIEGIKNLNTSEVVNMSKMFLACTSLKSLDLSKFNTSKVTDISFMFLACAKLSSLNIKNFNTDKVENMSHTFESCASLPNLDLSSFDTSSVTDMSYMFAGCKSLLSLDLSRFNTSLVEDVSNMFANCESLKELDLSSFDMTEVYETGYWFHNCTSLKTLTLPSTLSSVSNDIFVKCKSLQNVNMKAENPPILEQSLDFTGAHLPMFNVPSTSVNRYQTANGWRSSRDFIRSSTSALALDD